MAASYITEAEVRHELEQRRPLERKRLKAQAGGIFALVMDRIDPLEVGNDECRELTNDSHFSNHV